MPSSFPYPHLQLRPSTFQPSTLSTFTLTSILSGNIVIMSLHVLPYDLLFNIAQYLSIDDMHSLQATCRSLRSFILTRPLYRALAHGLLARSRPLPLPAFQRLADLSTQNLIKAVDRAYRFEKAWRVRAPRPARSTFSLLASGSTASDGQRQWYTKISAPPNEEIDWLSPITSSYTLCATKSGRVVCWDVARDVCLAEWDPRTEKKWELWKCRVEFDERAVYFTMARVLEGSYDDNRVMEFVLIKLAYGNRMSKPIFCPLTSFHTTGVVMNVFLLDPPRRLLSAFVWVATSNTIGLYVLLDWEKDEYVFVDTGVGCIISSNWSCILHEDQIVIHSEEADAAYQHFYPLSILRNFSKPRQPSLIVPRTSDNDREPTSHDQPHKLCRDDLPMISTRLPPMRSISKKFVFPRATSSSVPDVVPSGTGLEAEAPEGAAHADTHESLPDVESQHWEPGEGPSTMPPQTPAPNPYPFPPWYPESAHFVRQWWPTLAGVPRLSCTVVLLATHDPDTHRTRFVLAHHYFRVPIVQDQPTSSEPSSSSPNVHSNEDEDDEMLHLWYVSTPFEVVCVLDSAGDTNDEDQTGDRPRPLVAVDFGHAVWVEYAAEPGGVYGVDAGDVLNAHDGDGTIFDPRRHRVPKRLRFVTFPPVFTAVDHERGKARRAREEAVVRTLEIPDELDLDGVETINIDQSQGAVILSVKEGSIFILRYE
ncbi:hypothetical protein BU15DRAFT_50681 [Melanogaster broomeanus]|nr:hypothetical protein BU15DRAFT_50681 [Melanogaster broomeanus]